ncbi:hypothetical protein EW146_g5443 [Bondarzewia mesenterica]|uniref:TOG domain-containing protein n=1 Tax=Bondarzewia mesenterica TaxID=1095465 RepID=A0A4S4LRH4_9AGAM|nr:hypothetical protein EW146_g5443 [Bondarzewia mesenterica]
MTDSCVDCVPTQESSIVDTQSSKNITQRTHDPLDPTTFVPPSPDSAPRVFIEFCDRCRWLHRATWTSTELFLTFPPPVLGSITIVPLDSEETAGRFRVWLTPDSGAQPILVWDRKVEGKFPELKELPTRRNLSGGIICEAGDGGFDRSVVSYTMDDSNLSKLVQQAKANDVDVKVDAVSKLQAEFEAGAEIMEPDLLIQTFKTCLRTSNQHLSTATLLALPPFLPLLLSHTISAPAAKPSSASASTSSTSSTVDAPILRQVLNAFLPAGGVIDRLGETRERAREKARESLVLIGGFAFRLGGSSVMARSKSGKETETPLQMYERFLKEGGLGSKVWRVREQSILTLVHIRRTHHLFPIRPYLPLLVEALEDSDSAVRETARTSIVELFTGPGVTDAARSDLKKEMTKKGVRKGIVDGVLAKVLGGGGSAPGSEVGSDNGELGVSTAKKEYVPPSLVLLGKRSTAGSENASGPSGITRAISHGSVGQMPRPASRAAIASPPLGADSAADVQPVYVASSRDLENEFAHMFKPFEGKETEHNWAARDRAITRVRGMLKGDVHVRYADTFFSHLKQITDASFKTLASLRTTVATSTCSFYTELALALGSALDPVCEQLLLNLLRMAGFTKKIAAQASQAAVTSILHNTSAQPRTTLALLWNALQDKIVQARSYIVDHLKTYIETHGERARQIIESTGAIDTLEKSVRKALADPNVSVRQNARSLFWAFERVWKDRGRVILEAQDASNRKQLEKACPNPEALVSVPAAPATVKKSSVAAAIAASRAKAKAIATAPPTLRHQATSTARTISPPKRSLSPSVLSRGVFTERAASPLSPPMSPRSRILSTSGPTRSSSSRAVSHSRTPSSESVPSVTTSTQRRSSSPLVSSASSPPRGSSLRKAMYTALPASPPSTTITPPSPTPKQSLAAARQSLPNVSRQSTVMPSFSGTDEPSLLMAVAIPLPEDSDSDMDVDESNLISFSTPYKKFPPPAPSTTDSRSSFSPRSSVFKPELSTSLSASSPPTSAPQPIIEDAMRARAEQAESAAERLLELVEPEDETMHQPAMHSSLLLSSNGATPKVKSKTIVPTPVLSSVVRPPVTPIAKKSAIWKQVASFQDSPAHNGVPSLMTDVLRPMQPNNDSAWWRKRMALVNQRRLNRATDHSEFVNELQGHILALDQGTADITVLQNIAVFCISHPTATLISPLSSGLSISASPSPFLSNPAPLSSTKPDLWTENKNFDRLFAAVKKFLDPERMEQQLEYGLILLWEMLEHQPLHIEGREADVFAILLQVRYSNKQQIMESANSIRDALTNRIDPVYGLTTMHAVLRVFQTEPPPASSPAETKASTYAYGLIALGKFILRLPAEILEEELPRLKNTLISALSDVSSLVVRESAAAVIIAAQLILRDETHLFALLDGLPDEKKNLLTYLFDKHGARGASGAGGSPAGVDRLEREMRRLDGRTSTPPRSLAAASPTFSSKPTQAAPSPLSANLPSWSTSAFAGTLTALSGASSVTQSSAQGGVARVGGGQDRHVIQMIANASLDVIEEVVRRNNGMYLKAVDKFNEWTVSAFITPGNMKFILLHEAKNDEGIRSFFTDVWELYIKTMLNPFHTAHTPIRSAVFDTRVRASAKKYL